MDTATDRLRSLPVQVVSLPDGAVIKRGAVEVRVQGADATRMVQRLLSATGGNGMTREQLEAWFEPAVRPSLRRLVDHLLHRRMLVGPLDAEVEAESTDGLGPAAVFYWQFGVTEEEVAVRLRERRIVVLGVNSISARMTETLRRCGISEVEVVDAPALRAPDLFESDGSLGCDGRAGFDVSKVRTGDLSTAIDPESFGCMVATSERGGVGVLGEWNEYCHLHDRLFLPVCMRNGVGCVGPLVVPRETACLECLRSRWASNDSDPLVRRAVDEAAAEPDAVEAYLPAMASCLGDVAAMELLKHFGLGPGIGRAGVLIEVNLLAACMTPRPVARMPRCRVCTPLRERPLAVGSLSTGDG